MDAAARKLANAAARLLGHVAPLAAMIEERPSARTRLERELGRELTRFLVDALSRGPLRVALV